MEHLFCSATVGLQLAQYGCKRAALRMAADLGISCKSRVPRGEAKLCGNNA